MSNQDSSGRPSFVEWSASYLGLVKPELFSFTGGGLIGVSINILTSLIWSQRICADLPWALTASLLISLAAVTAMTSASLSQEIQRSVAGMTYSVMAPHRTDRQRMLFAMKPRDETYDSAIRLVKSCGI